MRLSKMSVGERKKAIRKLRNEMRQSLNARFGNWRRFRVFSNNWERKEWRKRWDANSIAIRRYGKLSGQNRFRYPRCPGF